MVDADLSLLERWREGDSTAGNELFKRHFSSLYRFYENKIDSDVDDLVQEAFLQCLKGRDTFKRQSTFRTYLFAIARYVLFQYWRKKATSHGTVDFEDVSIASLSTSAATRLSRNAERAQLVAIMRTLPVDQQLLLEMYYWEGLDRDQLSEVFDVEPATIGSRLFRARQALQEGMKDSRPGKPEELDAWARSLASDDQR